MSLNELKHKILKTKSPLNLDTYISTRRRENVELIKNHVSTESYITIPKESVWTKVKKRKSK